MSSFTYHGVTLPYVNITRFAQDAVREESDTDWILTKFDIEAASVVNDNYLSLLAPGLSTTNPCDIMNSIRTLLLKPRQALSVKFGGVELIPAATGGSGTVDAMNGPKPQSCRIIQMSNTTWLILYHIVAHYWENVVGGTKVTNKPGAAVLYNRWSEAVDIDSENFTTKTREGKFVIRSDNVDGFIADQCRVQMAAVSIPAGFLRQSSHYTVSPDGLGIAYRVVDKEVFKKPPNPAFRAEGRYSETTTKWGGTQTGQVNVRLYGAKDTSQAALLETAIGVCASKLLMRQKSLIARGLAGSQIIIEEGRVEVDMYQNIVECSLRGFWQAGNKRNFNIIGWGGDFTSTPASVDARGNPSTVNNFKPPFRPRGTASLLLNAAAYYDPDVRGQVLGAAADSALADNKPLPFGNGALQIGGTDVGLGGKTPGA